jgi:hypothetical protein
MIQRAHSACLQRRSMTFSFPPGLRKTVPQVSLNAIANLGYASTVPQRPAFSGDTLSDQRSWAHKFEP